MRLDVHCRKHCGTRNLHDPQGRLIDGGQGSIGEEAGLFALEDA